MLSAMLPAMLSAMGSARGIHGATSALPWVVLAVVGLALAGLAAVALVARARPAPADSAVPTAREPAGYPEGDYPDDGFPVDDLADFRDHPPGSARPAVPAGAPGRVGRLPPSRPDEPTSVTDAGRTVLVLAAVALLLLGAAAVVAGSTDRGRHPAPAPRTSPTGVVQGAPLAASVTFGGVVLAQQAVGVTAGYPQLTVLGTGRGARAQLSLTTVNCLATTPPADPHAAGCSPAATEYADLRAPDLEVRRRGAGLEVSGDFPTSTGAPSAPVATGRSYRVTATIDPTGPVRDGRAPAGGVLRIGSASAPSVGGDAVNELRYAG